MKHIRNNGMLMIMIGGGSKGDRRAFSEDRKKCERIESCGIGVKAIYLGSYALDRLYCLPAFRMGRVYKRIAMSGNGFRGKGAFASIPYLVAEYEDENGNKKERQCLFRREEELDRFLVLFHERFPYVPIHSEEAERKLEEKRARDREREEKLAKCAATHSGRRLKEALEWLEKEPELYRRLSLAARKKRSREQSGPAWRWAPPAFLAAGAAALAGGLWMLLAAEGGLREGRELNGLLLFVLAAYFLFAGVNVLSTGRDSKAAIDRELKNAELAMENYLGKYPDFPVPARYAHPAVLRWMMEILAEDKAENEDDALFELKKELKELNSDATVEQVVYEDVIRIKPLFLVENYR